MPDLRRAFRTERPWAREMSIADLAFTASPLSDPEVMRFYPKRYSREEARGWIERQPVRYEDQGHGLWLVLRRGTNEPVGQVGPSLQSVDGIQEPEVGYLIHRPFWRRGCATEAATAAEEARIGELLKRAVG